MIIFCYGAWFMVINHNHLSCCHHCIEYGMENSKFNRTMWILWEKTPQHLVYCHQYHKVIRYHGVYKFPSAKTFHSTFSHQQPLFHNQINHYPLNDVISEITVLTIMNALTERQRPVLLVCNVLQRIRLTSEWNKISWPEIALTFWQNSSLLLSVTLVPFQHIVGHCFGRVHVQCPIFD